MNAQPSAIVIDSITIRQDEHGRFCLNDLHKAAGNEPRHQPALFLRLDKTQEFIAFLHSTDPYSAPLEVINGGPQRGTYASKDVVYDYAAWVSPAFKLKVYRVFDAVMTGKAVPIKSPTRDLPTDPRGLRKALIVAEEEKLKAWKELDAAEDERDRLRVELLAQRPAALLGAMMTPKGHIWTVTEAARILRVQRDLELFPLLRAKRWISEHSVTGLVPYTCATGGFGYVDCAPRGTRTKRSGEQVPVIVWGLTERGMRKLGEILGRSHEVEKEIAHLSQSSLSLETTT